MSPVPWRQVGGGFFIAGQPEQETPAAVDVSPFPHPRPRWRVDSTESEAVFEGVTSPGERRGSYFVRTPRALILAAVLALAFLGQLLCAFLFESIPRHSEVEEAAIGTALLMALLLPGLYLCLYRPLERSLEERRLALDETRESREQLREYSARLRFLGEQERANIAREIHDEMGQALTALKMDLSWTGKHFGPVDPRLAEKVRCMAGYIDGLLGTVRQIATELRPGILDDLGLSAAIDWYAAEFRARTGIACEVYITPPHLTADPGRSIALFRVLQEALTNVIRHANAGRVVVRLRESPGSLVLEIQDDGVGIRHEQVTNTRSFGLLGMRERALAWGGSVEIGKARGKGTLVRVSLPDRGVEERP
jgi:signal transduction histidine kinase